MAARALLALQGLSWWQASHEQRVGAMLEAEGRDNLRVIARIATAWAEAMKKQGRRRGRRR